MATVIKQIKIGDTVHDIIDTTYSVVGSNGTTGLIKNGSTVTSSSGYTACPIVDGVPYYKDTNTTYSAGTNITISGTTISAKDTTYQTFTSASNGLVPKSGSSTSLFLKGDGTWATPTNTKNTAGATTTTSKIFLIGAISQATNPQTYSHTEVYVNTDHSIHADAFYENSDERLKTFTEDYDINLDDIKNIKTGRFYWNSDENQVINGGVSAQTVEEYFPELVREDENGFKSVNYDGLAVVAIAAIKKLTERIEHLENIINNK